MEKVTEKGLYRLADPSSNFELEPGKKVLSGGAVFSLEVTERVKLARRQGVLIPVREDGATVGGQQAASFLPTGAGDKPVTPKVNRKPTHAETPPAHPLT